MGRGSAESRERNQTRLVSSTAAGNAMVPPSGEIAVQSASSLFSGGTIEKTDRTGVSDLRSRDSRNPAASPISKRPAATGIRDHAVRLLGRRTAAEVT